jgi:glutaminase
MDGDDPSEMSDHSSSVSTGQLPSAEEVVAIALEAYERYQGLVEGVVADYIPALAKASPSLFGICLVGVGGRMFAVGDADISFSIQSISKVFTFALVCESIGYREARDRLGVNSTGLPFNSVMAIELSPERTINPMVNAGGIATTSLVPGKTAAEKFAFIAEGLSRFAGREYLLASP